MKKIILMLLIFAATFSEIATAQELEISLIEYNPETNYARIQIKNSLENDLHNVKFQINTLPSVTITPLLKTGTTTTRIANIPIGVHQITITSDETTATKEFNFQNSIQESLQGFEKEQRDLRRDVQQKKVIEQEAQKNAPIVEKKPYVKYLIITLIILILAAIAYFLIKKKNEAV